MHIFICSVTPTGRSAGHTSMPTPHANHHLAVTCISSVLVTHMAMCHRSWCYWFVSASSHRADWPNNMTCIAYLMLSIAPQHCIFALLAPQQPRADHALNKASSVTLNCLCRVYWTTHVESLPRTCCRSASSRFPQTIWCPS